MGLNDTPSGERIHIGFYGIRNAGKSSLVNAITGQKISLVSPTLGTTTDPVLKTMELLPLGPVVIIDTPGIDDEGELGLLRTGRTRQMLDKTDIAVLVTQAGRDLNEAERELIERFEQRSLPYIIASNKSDLADCELVSDDKHIYVSAADGTGIDALKNKIASIKVSQTAQRYLVRDLIEVEDIIILVTPIDESAPKGRLILPQQQTIRDILDIGAMSLTVQDNELEAALSCLNKKPKMVITDSQVFGKVNKIVPNDIPLTSFSILFARYKGELETFVHGAVQLDNLNDGDRILIAEGCTHHRQCNDIGSVKLPNLIRKYSGKELVFDFSSGGEFPENLDKYKLIVHCGGCMLNAKQMKSRLEFAVKAGVPITNYGIGIAKMNGILERSLSVFKQNTDKQ